MKNATGPYDRARLLDYLTEQGKNEKDWEHYKSYVPGEKKGKVWQPAPVAKSTSAEEDEFMVNTEWDDVLANASEFGNRRIGRVRSLLHRLRLERTFLSLAILGFTGLINQVQYHAALTDKSLPSVGAGWNGKGSTPIGTMETSSFRFVFV